MQQLKSYGLLVEISLGMIRRSKGHVIIFKWIEKVVPKRKKGGEIHIWGGKYIKTTTQFGSKFNLAQK